MAEVRKMGIQEQMEAETMKVRYRMVEISRWVLFKAFLRGYYIERWSPWGGELNTEDMYEE